ncbi:hypothetical protein LIER_35532 [Lithospermum erythrorhizon]|uniref:Reverse transcriptase domain-containing protein n=1 Tax=Lithospermum erythrorhizon TaxID=34254 RepID=A0AAV3NS69_LITER
MVFQQGFFQNYWSVVGEELTKSTRDFLNGGAILKETINTFITLIPKKDNPKIVSEFRPISLCNSRYKLASKVIVNRLKPYLNSIIFPLQNGFIPGCSINDNISMALELTHTIRTSTAKKNGLAAIKIDMGKAFDRIDWEFLFNTLKKFKFPYHWIHLIKECVSTVQYTLLVNGRTTKPFKPSCGLRQGDPLSHILFPLCTEALSASLSHLQSTNDIKGVSITRNGLEISHLLFANDSYFFLHVNKTSIESLTNTLTSYGQNSGQNIDFKKSQVFFNPKASHSAKTFISNLLSIPSSSTFDFYLGIPLDIDTKRNLIFEDFVDKIKKRINSWSSKFLNFGGKVTLIKSVLQSILVYPMSIFKFPLSILNKIDKLFVDFL